MTTPSQQSGIFQNMWEGIQIGGVIMLAQTPFVTGFNRISVVSCYRNLPMMESAKQIFQGTADSVKEPSMRHFLKGVSGHLVKESARLIFKASALVLKPQMDSYFGPSGKLKSDASFAGGLSVAEMAINPADTLRTMWQADKQLKQVKKEKILSHLYKGSAANGVRQFGIWLGFPASERIWSKVVEETTSIDPHSISGIGLKCIPQSIQITVPVWIFERVKNELQYHPKLNETRKNSSHYMTAFKHIIHTQGWLGIFRGITSKIGSIAILVIGADYLLEEGRRGQKVKTNNH